MKSKKKKKNRCPGNNLFDTSSSTYPLGANEEFLNNSKRIPKISRQNSH